MNRLFHSLGWLLLWFGTMAGSPLQGAPVIILDPGHGGRDPGAVRGRVYEKHLNLDLAMRVERYLKQRGYQVRLTRRSDAFVSLGGRAAYCNRYRHAVFVSLHFNAARNRAARGIETFHSGSSKSRRLAYHVHREAVRATGARSRYIRLRRFYVLRATRHPAILVEGGYMSHSSELRQLMSGSYRDRLARGIAAGIARGAR